MLRKIACGLFIGTAMAGASAQTDVKADARSSAYIHDSRGVIARSPNGLCWRTGLWTPADAVPGCDGDLVPPITKPTAPEIVPPTAAAAPAPAYVAAPAVPRCDFSVTLDSDQAFEFNKAVLSAAARKRIDEEVLPRLASCAKTDVVLITGHTDRIGTKQYNQQLSEKRAETVAAYLKTNLKTSLKANGGPAQIEPRGAGMTEPVKSCGDKMPKANLIRCLAPNRRVTIEARGTAN
jgi:OOP family OmpA-OmpF porin